MATTMNNTLIVRHDHTAPGSLDYTATRSLRVFDATGIVTTEAAVATTGQVLNAANAITNAFSLGNNAPQQVARAGTVNDANYLISSGGTLRTTLAGAGTAARIFVRCYPE